MSAQERRDVLRAHGEDEETLTAKWRALDETRQGVEHKIRTAWGMAVSEMRDRAVRRVGDTALVSAQSLLQEGEMIEILREHLVEAGVEQDRLAPLMEAIEQGFESGRLSANVDVTFNANHPRVRDTVRNVFRQGAQPFSDTTVNQMERLTTKANQEGWSTGTLRDKLGVYFDEGGEIGGMGPRQRADVGARTASTAQFGEGQLQAWRQAGIRGKRWLSQRDSRVRNTHQFADGQERVLQKPFNVGGFRLMHPGDPEAPIGETARCRCSMLPRENIDQDS